MPLRSMPHKPCIAAWGLSQLATGKPGDWIFLTERANSSAWIQDHLGTTEYRDSLAFIAD